ncbi:hypothetical protein Mgra_00007294 [Meloidogyne graminicola]|uniref:Uncharacterized protein n=1 Tax=Meloidogyne graminicola TaxID=189291 RepID=A0A8S9ZIZ4_9BILA|nr:hypothetical protein Mgra_00007294 [Meloidogyne graminicola]
MVYAYQFTNITAIQLLNSFTIPAVMLLSTIFLSTRYKRGQFIAVAICLCGLGLTIYTDALHTNKGTTIGTNKFIGDFLCLLGTFLYAVSNVSEECFVKQYSRSEFLTFIGIFGLLISLIQSYFMDYTKLIKFNWNIFSIFILTVFTFSMVLFYSLVSCVMQRSSALLFNIYVLTSDFYSMLAGIFLFGQQFYILYLIAFIIIIFGTILYNREETTTIDNTVDINEQEGI